MDAAVPVPATRGNGGLALLVLGLIFVLVVPLPPAMVDVMLAANLTVSLLILMATIHARRPLDFSTFPTILLFTALMRLSLNVACARLILLNGNAGNLIKAFGSVVVGGNYVVGIIVFLILIVIQFVVITKGQNRISEVAARFTLDAMPGKQMSIDADLNAGVITQEEAKARRAALTAEAEFFGAMDGAGKFIRGDAVAGLLITVINIIGGILIGMVKRDLTLDQAFSTYTILTIGDGLVAQIPALIISTASGILVTKSTNERALSAEIKEQLVSRPEALVTGAVILVAIGMFPGLPLLPFLITGGGLLLLVRRKPKAKAADAAPAKPAETPVEDLLPVDRLCIEIGYRLIGLVEAGKHGGLLEHIASLRRQFALRSGFVIPPIRVKDNIALQPNEFRVLVMGHEIARGSLRIGHYLAMDPTGTAQPVDGIDTVEPTFGLPARWVPEARKEQAERQGYTLVDPPSVLVTHLTELLKKSAHELLSREDVAALVDQVKKRAPAVVEELIPQRLSLGQVQRVLCNLLKEQVSMRNLDLILEALADAALDSKDIKVLTERARARLARTIVEPYAAGGKLKAVTIDPALERQLADAVAGSPEGLTLPPGFLARFVDRTAQEMARAARGGKEPVLLTRATLRPFLSEAISGVIPHAAVLSYQETAPVVEVETVGQVRVE